MRPRTVRELQPGAPVAVNARRIVRVRLAELYSFVPEALDEDNAKALHDMRIAAKRLRYALELMGFCLGPYAAKAARRVRELQDVIGAIHDCDVLQPQVHGEIAALRAADARELAAAVLHNGGGDPAPSSRTRRATYGALEALAVDQQARRAVLFAQFLKQWAALERSGFREKLQAALVTAPADSA